MDFKSFGKGIFVTVLIGFLLAGVWAFFEGQEFTQEQIDNFGEVAIQNASLDCENLGLFTSQTHYIQKVRCLSIEPIEANLYRVKWENNEYWVSIKDFRECAEENDKPFCKAFYKATVVQDHKDFVKVIKRESIKMLGTPIDNFDLTDFGLTDNELNPSWD